MNEVQKNIMLILEFKGTNYSGWQKQDNALSVSEAVREGIYRCTGEKVDLTGCSRTDSGVHAFNYVCNFKTRTSIPPEKIYLALNTQLPPDIACKSSKEVPEGFHSRYSAKSKRYVYMIQNTEVRSAIFRDLHFCMPRKLDVELMRQAGSFIVGRHDFRAFMASGSSAVNTVRTVFDLDISQENEMIQIDISGDGFLYNMVRIIAGTLTDAGLGKIKPEEVKNIIASGDRRKAGKTVPAHGLYLVEVIY